MPSISRSDSRGGPPAAPLLQELEASTRRAAGLYAQIRALARPQPPR
jgi:hypothetical protein